MSLYTERLDAFVRQMRAEHLPEIVIRNFRHYYRRLWEGETGLIAGSDIAPVTFVDDAEALPSRLERIGAQQVHRTAFIKLNGGLGTSMGMQGAKSLLKVKSSLTFMEIIFRQALCDGQPMPVIFMNSFSTRKDTLEILKK